MRLELDLPARVASGRPVAVALRLINPSGTPREVVLQGRPAAFDLRVTRADGAPVWRRLEHEVVTAVLQLRTFAAGETLALDAVWNQRDDRGSPVPPGDYLVSAEVPSDPPVVYRSPPRPLHIDP